MVTMGLEFAWLITATNRRSGVRTFVFRMKDHRGYIRILLRNSHGAYF